MRKLSVEEYERMDQIKSHSLALKASTAVLNFSKFSTNRWNETDTERGRNSRLNFFLNRKVPQNSIDARFSRIEKEAEVSDCIVSILKYLLARKSSFISSRLYNRNSSKAARKGPGLSGIEPFRQMVGALEPNGPVLRKVMY